MPVTSRAFWMPPSEVRRKRGNEQDGSRRLNDTGEMREHVYADSECRGSRWLQNLAPKPDHVLWFRCGGCRGHDPGSGFDSDDGAANRNGSAFRDVPVDVGRSLPLQAGGKEKLSQSPTAHKSWTRMARRLIDAVDDRPPLSVACNRRGRIAGTNFRSKTPFWTK